MARGGATIVTVAICFLGILCVSLADTSNAAVAQTLQQASNNQQIAGTSAKTSGAASPFNSPAAGSNQQASATAQSVQPTSLQASDVNKALLQATDLATQVLQNAPPANAIIPAGTTATTDSITIPRAQNAGSITLNPNGVTLKSSPDAPSMTIGNAGVRYNEPEQNPIPAQAEGSLFPGQGLSVVQNYPINDLGTGPAPKGNSNFQPLGSNVGAISTPAQNTESALASMGQGGHNTIRAASTQNSNPYFRNTNVPSPERTQSYAAAVPTQIRTSAGADPNAVTVTGPGGNSMTLGRRLLREIPSDDSERVAIC